MHPGDQELTEINAVDYSALTYLLINSVKELYAEVTNLKTQNVAIEKENAELKPEMERLKARDAAIESWACAQTPRPSFCK